MFDITNSKETKKFGLTDRILSLLKDERPVSKNEIIFYFNEEYDKHTVNTSISYAVRKKLLIRLKDKQDIKITNKGIEKCLNSKTYKSPWSCPEQEETNKLSIQFYKAIKRKDRNV